MFFGSFNPIHIGHLIIANVVLETVPLDEVWFIVSPQNPFKKSSRTLIHEFDRIDMVELAIEDNSRFKAIDIEFHLPKPSYTIDTLTRISDKYPENSYYLILGEDNLHAFPKWKNFQVILDNYKLVVYPRPKSKPSPLVRHPKVKMVDAPLLNISASLIRKLIKNNQSVRYLVPDKVIGFIADRKLYLD